MEISLCRFLFLSKVDRPAVHTVSTHQSPSVVGEHCQLTLSLWMLGHAISGECLELVETNDFLSIRRVQDVPPTHSVPSAWGTPS